MSQLLSNTTFSTLMFLICAPFNYAVAAEKVDISDAVVVVRPGDITKGEKAAARILTEEVNKRTGLNWNTVTSWPRAKTVIAITAEEHVPQWKQSIPKRTGSLLPETKPEGYRVHVESKQNGSSIIWIQSSDSRGALFGAGELLRNLKWSKGEAFLPNNFAVATSPVSPIRGHQLGYRDKANSWDAWTIEQFDQYIRDLAVFGTNSFENIPFQDSVKNPMMKYSRRDFNKMMSEVCDSYDVDYWVWTPADFDLQDEKLRNEMLEKHETLYRDCKRLDGIFFPAGDPGDNAPELVMPFLVDLAKRLDKHHPGTKFWLSLQRLSKEHIEYVFKYIETEKPTWLGGLVAGPSSMPIPMIRKYLPKEYKLRLYPDITHNKLCQHIVPWWDPAYSETLGREAINPRPREYAKIHNLFAPYSDGFISYSDGCHDDVNKVVWSMLGTDPNTDVRKIIVEYCRYFFGPDVAEEAADGIFALEKNWQGALADNGAVEGTLLLWQKMEQAVPHLAHNWRWQMNLVRAYYDAYTRRRLLYETKLKEEANQALATAPNKGADVAMQQAMAILNKAVEEPVSQNLHTRIKELCQDLFDSIKLQTSVELYGAAGAQRGAFLDFVNHPLNNRWWYEDQFAEISQLGAEEEKLKQLKIVRTWETPGPGSFYDDIGNIAKSPHQIHWNPSTSNSAMYVYTNPSATYWWLDGGYFRGRTAWLTTMSNAKMVYEGLDPDANYVLRVAGYGKSLLKADGKRLPPTINNPGFGEFKEFSVPQEMLQDQKLIITWDLPSDEAHLNWRKRSRNAEIWLLKQPNTTAQ